MDLQNALIDWDDPNDEASNAAHVAEHDLSTEEVESVLRGENTRFDVSDRSGRPIAFGYTSTGRFIALVFEVLNWDDPLVIRPITAYEVSEPTE
ncbi:MAG: DUF4258 domain-containing protein [Planctomycetes bacterium]|nr:DUF4258 domain-containing protein [Planctomycetota bacterium]